MTLDEERKHYRWLLDEHRKRYEEAIRPILKALAEIEAVSHRSMIYVQVNDGTLDQLRSRGLSVKPLDGLPNPVLDVEVR